MEKERIIEILEKNVVMGIRDNHICESEFDKIASEIHQEFEAEKQDLVEALLGLYSVMRHPELYPEIKELLEKHTGKSIEELLK